MIKRPKPNENEDDILRMQEDFLRERSTTNVQPSAQVVNLRKTESSSPKRTSENKEVLRKPSKYAQSRGLLNDYTKRTRTEDNSSSIVGDITEKYLESLDDKIRSVDEGNDKVYFPTVRPSLLGNIVEKNSDSFIDFGTNTMPSEGFPVVSKRDPNILPGEKSIHALHFENLNINKEEKMDIDRPNVSDVKNLLEPTLSLFDKSYILTSTDADSIHGENVNILSKMSEQDILEEQQKLLSTLDPKIIEFVKKKRQDYLNSIQCCTATNNDVQEMETSSSKELAPVIELEDPPNDDCLWENDVLSNPNINKWLNFDTFEKDKMEWMKAIAVSKKIKPNEPYEARFDLKGYLLPYAMDYTEATKTLFHHGEEPHRPGYSITELFDLCRSTITQQRAMALNTLAGVLEYYSAGTYKDVLELPITKIFFIIRIAMDENKTIILEPALKALRNLVYNRIDEASLDALIGFQEGTYQPCLENDKSEITELDSTERELKDFHLAEIDLIAALLRTDILQRLYYIMETIKPSYNCVQYCLQILTRLARDSIETSSKIVSVEHLMKTIILNFLPVTNISFSFDPSIVYKGKPILAALKLIRVLSLQSNEIGHVLVSKYEILKPLSTYISSGTDGTYGLHIQIEAFSTLSNLLHYNIGVENALSVFPIVVTTLYKHVQGTNVSYNTSVISATHAAVVLQFINRFLQCNCNLESQKFQIYPLLKEGIQKWLTQTANIDRITCGHLRLVCSLLDCCSTISVMEKQTLRFLNVLLENLSQSQGFKEIMKHLISNSNLLSGIEAKHFLVTKNLVSLESIVVDKTQKELPILNVTSPIPFLASLFKLLTIINEVHISNSYMEHFETYLRILAKRTPSLCDNWFTRMETELVFNIVKIAVQCSIAESKKDLIYTVANKLCYILRADKKYELEFVFQHIIFNKEWFTTERLFNLVSLSEKDGFSRVLSNVEDIRTCYCKVIKLNYIRFEPNIVLRIWKAPILPRDWIYLPILALYSKSQEAKPTVEVVGAHAEKVALQMTNEKERIVGCSLEWILFNEICFPDLMDEIDVTDRFCRFMCVFLCDSSLFLEPFIKVLLRKCTEVLFKKSQQFNFDKELTGLNNFQDFYTQFLEHFQGVSYGDPCFAACVLVPLAQRHNVKWRKTLWSEYAGCLRALDCPLSYLCYELTDYLYPVENDESLLKCYHRALNSNLLRPGTIVHKIAEHHVNIVKMQCMSKS